MALGTIKLGILDRHSQPESLSCGLWSISFSIVKPLHGIFLNICTRRKIEFSSAGKEYACNAGDPILIAGSRRSAGEGIGYPLQYSWASLVAQMVKNLPAMQKTWVWSLGWEDPWRRPWQPTPVFLPVESHGQRSLASYHRWGSKKSNTTEWLSTQHRNCSIPSPTCERRVISQWQHRYEEAEEFIPKLSQRDQHPRIQLFLTENHLDYKTPWVIYSFYILSPLRTWFLALPSIFRESNLKWYTNGTHCFFFFFLTYA